MVTGLIIHLLPFPRISLHPPLSWPHRLHHPGSIDSGFWLNWANVRQFKRAKGRGKGSIGESSLPTAPSASARLFCSWLHPSRTISPPLWTPTDSSSSSRLQVHAPSLLLSVPQVLSLGASTLPAGFLNHPQASVKSPFCSVSPESRQNMPFVFCGPLTTTVRASSAWHWLPGGNRTSSWQMFTLWFCYFDWSFMNSQNFIHTCKGSTKINPRTKVKCSYEFTIRWTVY